MARVRCATFRKPEKLFPMKTTILSHTKFDNDAIVAGLRSGSGQALEQIVATYRPRLHALALRFTRNHHDAEDIVQDAFLRAFRAAPEFRGDSSLGTWLHSIVTNLARNRYWYWQRRKKHETVSLDAPVNGANKLALGEVLAREDATTSEQVEQFDLADQIGQGMARLSERDRRILELRNIRNATYTEIASALEIELGTVKSRIFRARDRLRTIVNDRFGGDSGVMRKAC